MEKNSKPNDQVISEIDLICKTYELKNHELFIDALLGQQNRILAMRKNMVTSHPNVELRRFSKTAIIDIQNSISWVLSHRIEIEKRLKRKELV